MAALATTASTGNVQAQQDVRRTSSVGAVLRRKRPSDSNPRSEAGELIEAKLRVARPVPVKAGELDFDMIVLNLKPAGAPPQAEEVAALQRFIRAGQSGAAPRRLIVLGN